MSENTLSIIYDNTLVKLYKFESTNGVNEYYLMLSLTDDTLTYKEQQDRILEKYKDITKSNFYSQLQHLSEAKPVFINFFLSDAANQKSVLDKAIKDKECAISIVQQPPLNGTKIAMLAILMTNTTNLKVDEHLFKASHNGYDELWSTDNKAEGISSLEQTQRVFSNYVNILKENGCTLVDNCLRTWLYVNDIDNQYAGVVEGRNDIFDEEGLTNDTHFISSTGIGGRDANPKVLCKMNAIAIKGIRAEQIHYLYALDKLNRTSEYGVRFERGSYIDFDERRRVYISGTASIDNKGNVLYEGDIRKQTERMLENIEALLEEANCTFEHVAEITVYLRDIADYKVVDNIFNDKFANTPYIIVNAPVCRPGWLIEAECIALRNISK